MLIVLVVPVQSERGNDSHSEYESMGGGGMDYSDEDKTFSDILTYEQIRNITIRRSKLAKWVMEPFFEELIIGCFVRVGIGMKDGRNVYRLCIVQHVESSDPNKIYPFENRTTHKYLNCVWGNEHSAAKWQMARVSDSPPSPDEFNEWRREVERTGGRMPHSIEVQKKQEAIGKINSFVYSAETVKQMVEEKKSVSARPLNIAAEKQKPRRELESAEAREDVVEIERIKARLHKLEAVRQGQDQDAKALKLAEMNRKNRAENFRNSSMRAADKSLNPGDAGYDPFSRRWTRSRNYYSAKQEGEGGTNTEGDGTATENGFDGRDNNSSKSKNMANAGVNASDAAEVAADGAGKLVDTRAPVDQGTEANLLHNFDLPISLSLLERFGGAYGVGAAFLARKQRIEANIGCRVPEDDGRNHPMSLSVGDYKRRRGLL